MALGKDEKFKCTIVFFGFFCVFITFYLFSCFLLFFLLLWDENPNGTSVPYLLFKDKNVKLKFCKDEEKIVKIFPQLRGCFWIEEAKEVRLRFSDPLKREEDLKTVKVGNPIKRKREKIKVMLFSRLGSLGEWASLFLGHTKSVFVGPP